MTSRPEPSWSPSTACAAASRRHLRQGLGSRSGRSRWASSLSRTISSAGERLACPQVARYPVLMSPHRLTAVDHGLLEPLVTAYVRALQCFLVVCRATARVVYASARTCGAGSSASRVRSRYVCVTSERCTAGCLGTEIGTVRAHDGPVRRLMACLNPHGP